MDERLDTVPKAGRKYFGLGVSASYEAARRGDIPTIKIGKRIYAVIPAIERRLNGEGIIDTAEAQTDAA